MEDVVQAFTPHAPLGEYGPAHGGPLFGLTFAVKDLFDVKGLVTGAGTPDWAGATGPATSDAPVVARLRAAGARFVGKTITDELAWSLGGENVHYGTPINAAARDRVVGGSSSGSAAAVAAGLADVGLGTDTGGSVRLPASYTGLWSLRTTHGALPVAGVVPLAPSLDTVGWLARDAITLDRVGAVLMAQSAPATRFSRVLIAGDLFDRVDPDHAPQLRERASSLAAALGYPARSIALAPQGIDAWRDAFRICQAAEAWDCHGAWITTRQPDLGADIAARFRTASRLTRTEITTAQRDRATFAARLHDLLGDDGLILLPGAPSPAHRRGQSATALAALRSGALDMFCPASLAGTPQLSVPGTGTNGLPLGLGVIAGAGQDRALLALARHIAALGATASAPASRHSPPVDRDG